MQANRFIPALCEKNHRKKVIGRAKLERKMIFMVASQQQLQQGQSAETPARSRQHSTKKSPFE
jgi:hypothetical protein